MSHLWYSPTQKGCKCFHPLTKMVFVAMDVTFFLSHNVISPKLIFKRISRVKDQFWDGDLLPRLVTDLVPTLHSPSTLPIAEIKHKKISTDDQFGVEEEETEAEKPCKLQVYSRRDKSKKNCQSFDSNMVPMENIGNTESCLTPSVIFYKSWFIDPIVLVSDLDLHVALRKGVRSCTQHPISNLKV